MCRPAAGRSVDYLFLFFFFFLLAQVMGLMLREFVDDYTVRVVDVFAMPQSGTGVSVEAVDPVFQTKMFDMLTGREGTNGRRLVP